MSFFTVARGVCLSGGAGVTMGLRHGSRYLTFENNKTQNHKGNVFGQFIPFQELIKRHYVIGLSLASFSGSLTSLLPQASHFAKWTKSAMDPRGRVDKKPSLSSQERE